MNSVVRKGDRFYLTSCWGPPVLLAARRDNPLLTRDVLRAIVFLRQNPGVRTTPASAAGRDGLGDFAGEVIAGLLPEYRKAIRRYEPVLYEQGRKVGKSIVRSVWGAAFAPPSKPSGPAWLPQVIDPVLQPFQRGLVAATGPGLLLPLAGGLLALFGLGYALGRRRR